MDNPLRDEMTKTFDSKSLDQDETHLPSFDLAFKTMFRSAEWICTNQHDFFGQTEQTALLALLFV